MKTYLFHIHGMHCNACVALTEGELGELSNIAHVKSSLSSHTIEIKGDFGEKDTTQIAQELNLILKPHGYTLHTEKQKHSVRWSEFQIALPTALGFMAVFVILQKLGVVNLVNASQVTLGTAFFIGLVASVSTCMAVVGGLVLSLSSTFAKEGQKIQPQLLFHIGRIVSFFLLGGLIGMAGSVFQMGVVGTFILSFIVGLVMFILGLNLLEVFPWAKKLQPSLPSFFAKNLHTWKNVNHTLTPLLVGALTFFLPCGFTQSMQLYTLTTGNFWSGALTMGAFALGTLPMLALLSFGSLAIHKKSQSGIFFKSAGLVVIFFALFNLYNSSVAAGFLPPLFSF